MDDSLNRTVRFRALLGTLASVALLSAGAAFAAPVPLPSPKPVIAEAAPLPLRKPAAAKADLPAAAPLSEQAATPVPPQKPAEDLPTRERGEDDAALYRKIFDYQAAAEWSKADALLGQIKDQRLRGHVLFQRYMHPTAYTASFGELESWMKAYADQPDADKVYALAQKRMPPHYAGSLKKPGSAGGIRGFLAILSDHDKSYGAEKSSAAGTEKLRADIGAALKNREPDAAYKTLLDNKAAKKLSTVEYDTLRAQIANIYMVGGNPKKAKELAAASAKRSGGKVPLAGWVGGLSAWKLGEYRKAATLFEQTADSPYASSWTAAGGAYWASRAHMRAGNTAQVSPWLRRAAAHPRTFYGLIATRALGWDFDFNWEMPEFTAAHKKLLGKYPAAKRAMLLAEAHQYHLAEQELLQISPNKNAALTQALLAFANKAGLPSYAMRLATAVAAPDGALYDAALYPVLPWRPQDGYTVDRALIHALIRQESKFNPSAENGSGATGLMQLMPATASFVSGQHDYRSREGRHSLKDPQVNLELGQKYVEDLLHQDSVSMNLFALVTAYNAGPGNLKKWQDSGIGIQDDPLLFVELIPLQETRDFVEKVMANYWIYRLRMNRPAPSLDETAAGRWARYADGGDHEDGFRVADGSR